MHSAATPRFSPRLRSAPSSVTTMRAPTAPIGWPSAQAPPCTLTISCGSLNSAIAAIVTAAKASLTSHRSTCLASQPAFFSALSMAPAGAVANHSGACACTAWPTMRAIGLQPMLRGGAISRISTSAAAPSEMLLSVGGGDGAVLLERGLQRRDLVELGLEGLLVELDHRVAALAGQRDRRHLPVEAAVLVGLLGARGARRWRSASCASRVKRYLSTHCSANTPIALPRS